MPPQTELDNKPLNHLTNSFIKSVINDDYNYNQWKVMDNSNIYTEAWIKINMLPRTDEAVSTKTKKKLKYLIMELMEEEAVMSRSHLQQIIYQLIPSSIIHKRHYFNQLIKDLPFIRFSIPTTTMNTNIFNATQEPDYYYILPAATNDAADHIKFNHIIRVIYKLINIIIKLIYKRLRDEEYAALLFKHQYDTFAKTEEYLGQSFNINIMNKLFTASKLRKYFELNKLTKKQRNRVFMLETSYIDEEKTEQAQAKKIADLLTKARYEMNKLIQKDITNASKSEIYKYNINKQNQSEKIQKYEDETKSYIKALTLSNIQSQKKDLLNILRKKSTGNRLQKRSKIEPLKQSFIAKCLRMKQCGTAHERRLIEGMYSYMYLQ